MDGTKHLKMIDLVTSYMDWHVDDWSDATKRAYGSLYRDFAAKWDAQRPQRGPKQIDRLWIGSYFVGPDGIGRHSAPSSYNLRRTQLKAFVEWCVEHGYFKPGVWPDKLKKRRPAPREHLRLNVTEMDLMMDRADPYDRWVIALLRYTLLRESEALRIIVGDVTIAGENNSTIRVLRTKAEREDGALHYDDMPMWGELVDEYHRWMRAYEKLIGGPVLDSYPLVPRWVGKAPSLARPWETRVLKVDKPPKALRPIIKKHLRVLYPDMPPERLMGAGAHTMRRSGAVELLNALEELGEADPMSVVQSTLDHGSVRMTAHYIGLKEERRRRNKTFARYGRLRPRPGLHAVADGREEVS